jgi:hypothetical protein
VVGAIDNDNMRVKSLYGQNVSKKIVDGVLKKIKNNGSLFQFDHQRLNLEEFFDHKI